MERTKRMLIVMLTSFGIFALLTFLTFSSYGKTITSHSQSDYTLDEGSETIQVIQEIELNTKADY